MKQLTPIKFIVVLVACLLFTVQERGIVIKTTQAGSDITTERVSVTSGGVEGNASSGRPAISIDGRYVSYISSADNLVVNDNNGYQDIFVHDRALETTSRISISSGGVEANGNSFGPSISANGRYVTFSSDASNLVAVDSNNEQDVFIHDRQTGETTLVSVAYNGAGTDNYSGEATISSDGQYVTFSSPASNLVPGDTNNFSDVFIYYVQSGQITQLSKGINGEKANGDSQAPVFSFDGRFVSFYSNASNLTPIDSNNQFDIFVYDLTTGQIELVSVASDGTQSNGYSHSPSISANGRYVAFPSSATNLVTGDTNGKSDTFVYDRETSTTIRVSVASDGSQGLNGGSYSSIISNDGNYVAFESFADNLVPGDTNAAWDIFIHNRLSSETTRVSVATDNSQSNGSSQDVAFSGDGTTIAFKSAGSNLVAGDSNGVQDIFVRGQMYTFLAINYQVGAPGSYFTLNANNFSPSSTATISVNGQLLGNIPTSNDGNATFLLTTGIADEGAYFITVSTNPSATTHFVLDLDEPIRPQEGNGPVFDIPSGIAFTEAIFLPFVID